ncbi:MAG: hypothetical protein FWH35_02135 [Treponema sp.]|nr:hypothetical protein [Treponema sp.]
MNIIEQVKALENGKGIQYLLDSAYKIFNNPVYMVDAYYNLIAFSDNPIDDYYWNELIKKGTFPTNPLLDLIDKEDLLTVITASKKCVLINYEKWEYGRMTGHIFNRDNNWVGQATMHAHIPFDEERTEAFEILTEKISGEIYDYEYFTKLPIAFHNDIISRFLDKSVEKTIVSIPHTQVMYHGFEKFLYVAVMNTERNNNLEHVHQNRLEYFRSLLKTRYKSFKYAIYKDKIVMLMSSKYNNLKEASFFTTDNILLEENNLHIGVSGSFENILEMHQYYNQALSVLENGMKSPASQRLFLYDEKLVTFLIK